MPINKQNNLDSKTLLTSAGGNIESTASIVGNQLTLTHPSGSNFQIGNNVTSNLNTGNSQNLTLVDSFSTTMGDQSNYVKGNHEFRFEGDSIEFIGPTTLITNDVIGRWYKEYGATMGALKSQFQDNRFDFNLGDYPINSVYEKPINASNIVVCPELKNGTAENNKNTESKAEFEKSMMDPETIKNSEATKALQEQINNTYNDFNANAESLYKSTN